MHMIFHISVLILVSVCLNTANGYLSTLRFVNMVFRHGARAPVRIYSTNPFQIAAWPQKTYGWLTPRGEQDTEDLGKYVRSRYHGFLNDTYEHDELKIWSSDVYRTVMSAHSFLDGLYNYSTGPIIPVMTVGTPENDDLLYMSKHCPNKDLLRGEAFGRGRNEINTEYGHLFRFLENVTGEDNVDFGSSIFYIVDCLECQVAYELPVPEWYNVSVREDLLKINDMVFVNLARGDDLKRLTGGPLLKRMTGTLKSKQIPGLHKEKVHIYSAHDSTLASLLTAMDIFDEKRPTFASAVLLELHEIAPNNYSVQVLYKTANSAVARSITDQIKGCSSEMCPFETFMEGVKSGIPDDWEKECGLTEETEQPECSTQTNNPNKGSINVFSHWLEMVTVILVLMSMS